MGVDLSVIIAVFIRVVVRGRVPRRARAETKAVAPPPPPPAAIDVVIVAEGPFEGAEEFLVLEILGREGLVQAREGRVVVRDDGLPLRRPPRGAQPRER